jgi:hypothetical protein
VPAPAGSGSIDARSCRSGARWAGCGTTDPLLLASAFEFWVINGPINGKVFSAYVEKVLVPTLVRRDRDGGWRGRSWSSNGRAGHAPLGAPSAGPPRKDSIFFFTRVFVDETRRLDRHWPAGPVDPLKDPHTHHPDIGMPFGWNWNYYSSRPREAWPSAYG